MRLNTVHLFFNFKRIVAVFILLIFTLPNAKANNVVIADVTNTNAGAANPELTFKISWNNSWKVSTLPPHNYDAVWVFVKYQEIPVDAPDCDSYLEWKHAKMSATPTDFSASGLLTLETVADNAGVFLYRTADGTGDISPTDITITLDLPAPATGPSYNFKVFAIEMVNIPQGEFYLGDGVSANSFNKIKIDNSTDDLTAAAIGGLVRNTIPKAYPNGYNSFYSMKYELSQQQYVDFLNTLTFNQQITRSGLSAVQLATDPGVGGLCIRNACKNRNGIKMITHGENNNISAKFACDFNNGDAPGNLGDGQTIAMNYLSLGDLYAYLDWAALRPMTNLEFEKISRGPLSSIGGDYIWGSQNITQARSNDVSNPGRANELANVAGNGLAAYGATADEGPLRVGFSATSGTDRETSGSSYYGVMNLGGNLWEMIVGGSNPSNLGYKLTYADWGDGNLNAAGDFNTPNWQTGANLNYANRQCTSSSGGSAWTWYMELRGGGFNSVASTLRTSDRSEIGPGYSYSCASSFGFGNTGDTRRSDVGGRGVR